MQQLMRQAQKLQEQMAKTQEELDTREYTAQAGGGMILFSLDLMHFTQTRIATIDSFPVLFILLSTLCMVTTQL